MLKISVLIPTYNADSYILDLIKSLQSQELNEKQTMEIIVIDSSSNDDTLEIIKNNFPQVKVITIANNCFNHGGTRNKLADEADGDFLLFMTQDALPCNNHLIKNLLHSFDLDNKIVVAYARQVARHDASDIEKFNRLFNYPDHSIVKKIEDVEKLGVKTFFNSNVCSMYRKDIFNKLDRFPDQSIMNEDMIFATKVINNGYKIYYCSEALVYHSHNYNLLQQFKRYFDIGTAFTQIKELKQLPSNGKEGFRFFLSLIQYLCKKRKFTRIPYAFFETVIKFFAYQLGKKNKQIPYKIRKLLSAYLK
ncbi:glycosyltransferase family 2 protein [Paenibacillus hamazuiensis]|uniref:glycosyltransferase family 2 protein n=1 Tax=Paenibacillus hamazuiensis TaxID=2936508 RepID=UPI00200C759C|nr:glycosyltransferase [Paenibacillus hamazuiensis]